MFSAIIRHRCYPVSKEPNWLLRSSVCGLAFGLLALSQGRTYASIIAPASPVFALGDRSEGAANNRGGMAGAGSRENNANDSGKQNTRENLIARDAFSPTGTPSSTSTTTTSGGSGGSSSSAAVDTAVSDFCGNPAIVCWLSAEHGFSLPTPLGTDLLRPPQFA